MPQWATEVDPGKPCQVFRVDLMVALTAGFAVGLQGTVQVSHRIHAGLSLGVGAHHPIGEAALLDLDLLGQLACRSKAQSPLEQLTSFRLVGVASAPP